MPVYLMPRCARRISSAVIALIAVTAVLTAAIAIGFAAPAMAATSSIAVATSTTTPEQAIPVDLSFSGTNALAGNAEVEALVRPAGGPACLSSYQEDFSTFGGEDTAIIAPGAQSVAPGAFDVTGTFKPPAPGSYQICAWLAQNLNSTDQPVSSPATLTVAARPPQVSQLTVNVPKDLQPNVTFPVSYVTQTDQQLSLYSVIYTASQGPCPASFDENQQQGKVETLLSGIGSPKMVFGGPSTTTVNTKQKTGLYLVCTWVEGPNPGEVDGTLSTPVTVGTLLAPPTLKLTRAAASRRHGVTVAGSTASGFAGKLAVSAACGSATAHSTATARNRRFSSALALPRGCRQARKVKLTVSWAGSSAFAKQTVTKTVAIAK
jgi:hypothetical protein